MDNNVILLSAHSDLPLLAFFLLQPSLSHLSPLQLLVSEFATAHPSDEEDKLYRPLLCKIVVGIEDGWVERS